MAKRASLLGVSPARACAFAVIRRVFERGAYADRAMHAEAAGLDPRERAFATALAYGTVQRCATLDHVAGRLCSRPLAELDAPILAALRVGLFQLLFLDGVAEHAAVNESVELTKLAGRSGAGGKGALRGGVRRGGGTLVNAVMRRAIREGPGILDALDDRTPERAALMHSLPPWLAERWWQELGADRARTLMRVVNEPAESALRVNTLRSSIAEVRARLPVPTHPAPGLPEGLVLEGPFDAHGSSLFTDGAIMPQSRGSMLVARVLDPSPGDRVLDLCAAPGAKTTQLAALMGDAGEVVAVERHRGRAEALQRTCRRMGAGCVRVVVSDALGLRAHRAYDSVLVDPPCSGLGTLAARPDLRWRMSPGTVAELAALQRRILAVAGAATAPAGVLTYSVCTISRQEGEEVVRWFLREHPEFVADDLGASHPEFVADGLDAAQPDPSEPSFRRGLQLLPHRDGTDGFFLARLRRAGSRGSRYPWAAS